jgi:hypothetical protein
MEIKSQKESLIDYSAIEEIAYNCGIHDKSEILESVKFLNDLGSILYFEDDNLKNKVIINPQVKNTYYFQYYITLQELFQSI